MQFRWILIGLILTGMGTGCYELREGMNDWAMSTKSHFQARHAWHRLKPYYKDLPHCDDFKDGFLEGYCSVACGGTGCQPTLPPREYWSVWYQNPEGQQMQHAWFDGYSHGALAAQQDNVPVWNQIVISNQARTHLAAGDAEHHISINGGSLEGNPPMLVPPPAPAAEDAAQRQAPPVQGEVLPASHAGGPALPFASPMPSAGDSQGFPSTSSSIENPQPAGETSAIPSPEHPNVFPRMPQYTGRPGMFPAPQQVPMHRHVPRPTLRQKLLRAVTPVTHDYNPDTQGSGP